MTTELTTPTKSAPHTKRLTAKRRAQREALAALVAEAKRKAPACEEFRFDEPTERKPSAA